MLFFFYHLYIFLQPGKVFYHHYQLARRALIFNIKYPKHNEYSLNLYYSICYQQTKNFNIFYSNKLLIILLFIFYLLLFYNFIPSSFGGGAINKLLTMVSTGYVLKYLILVFSFFSLILMFALFRYNKFILIYFSLNILLFCTLT